MPERASTKRESNLQYLPVLSAIRNFLEIIVCLALTKLTGLGEPKCLYGESLAGLVGWPYVPRVNLLAEASFISHVYEI